ncbi:MAG: hypothetical protein WBA93_07005 [Microcoleaceae cyanobacterium]
MKKKLNPVKQMSSEDKKDILKIVISSAIKLSVIGIIVLVVAWTINARTKYTQEQIEQATKEEQVKQEEEKPLLAAYTVVLNQPDRSVKLILKNGVEINLKNLNSKQTECMIFGGGIGCIDSLYIPGEDRREGSEENQTRVLKIQQSVNDFLKTETGGWALAFGIAIFFLVIFFGKKKGD